MNPYLLAAVYAVVGMAVVPLVFAAFKTQYQVLDVALASLAAAAVSLIPDYGGGISFATMVGVLYWRLRDDLYPDILLAVFAARLAAVPVLLLIRLS